MTTYERIKVLLLYWLIAGTLAYGMQLGWLLQLGGTDAMRCREYRKIALFAAVLGPVTLPLFMFEVVIGRGSEGGFRWTCDPPREDTVRKEC